MDQTKTQGDALLGPADAPPGAIVSSDTRRENRIPPGQSRTKKWPILDASGAPPVDAANWTLKIGGLVNQPIGFDWEKFNQLPRVQVFWIFTALLAGAPWQRMGRRFEPVS